MLIALTLLPTSVRAQEAAPKGLTVGPFLIELDVAKGGTVQSEVFVANNTESEMTLTITPRDFLPGEDGQAVFVPDQTENDSTFSLASWIKISGAQKFALHGGEKKTIPFSVNPPVDAEDGTHYGAILFNYESKKKSGGAMIKQSVGPLVLVRYGTGKESGRIKLLADKKLLWSPQQINFIAKFYNEGNVHVKPKGEIYFKNIFGKVESTTFINRDGVNALPQSNRIFFGSWQPSKYSFGLYRAELVMNYGDTRQETRDKIYIWVLPWYYIIFIIVVAGLIAYYHSHGRYLYHRYVVRKHDHEE